MKKEYRKNVLHTDKTMLYCSIREGIPAIEYFTMADLFSTYRVNLTYDDLCAITDFLDSWDSEPLEIVQPYTTLVNGCPSFCVLKFEYVENPDKNDLRSTFQRISFYAECYGKDLEDSLKEEKIMSWSSWDDYYNWDEFEELRSFFWQMEALIENNQVAG